jgi:hypothetical protein
MESERAVVSHAGNDSEALVKGLKRRIRIALTLAFSLIACGFVCLALGWVLAGSWLFILGLMPLPYALWLRSKQRTELAKQGCPPKKDSLVWVVVSRGFLATCLAAVPDPMIIFLLGTLAGIALVVAGIGKSTDARVRLVKAAIYGVAAMVVYIHVADDRNQVDVLAGKLEEYRRQHGEYPEKLDAMVPALLPAIPKPGLGPLLYNRKPDSNSYWLSYRMSADGRCSYTPELKLKCHTD